MLPAIAGSPTCTWKGGGAADPPPVDESELGRIAALFRLDFDNRSDSIESMRGKPVWLGLAVGSDGIIRMKPQNLLTNLPVRRRN